jgi:alkyl hydroperoxide reductase subunit AhpC
MPLVGRPAPDFTAKAVIGSEFVDYTLSSNWTGKDPKYTLLFFYPLDFTFVCPTEIIAFSDANGAFAERGVQLMSCSIDSHYTHLAWRQRPRSEGGLGDIQFPMLADVNRKIGEAYGVLTEGGVALRGLFLIDKQGVVRYQVVNDLPLGRSVDETLRMVDALQYFEENGEVCPANWKKGGLTIKPDPKRSREYFERANA